MEHEWLEMDFDKAWLLDKGTMILMCEKCGMVFNALHEEAGT